MSEDVFRFVIAAGVVLAGIAFVVQAAVLLALYRVTKGGQDRFAPLAENAGPILSSTRNLLQTLDQNTPRINEIVQDISAVTHSAREQAARLNALVEDATTRATRRLAELDQTVDLAVEQVDRRIRQARGSPPLARGQRHPDRGPHGRAHLRSGKPPSLRGPRHAG